MRIAHITPAGGFGRVQLGGAERAVWDLANESSVRGHEVRVFAPPEFWNLREDEPRAFSHVGIELNFSNVRALAGALRSFRPDVVVTHLLRGVLVGGAITRIALPRVPLVSNLHNSLEQAFDDAGAPPRRRRLVRASVRAIHLGSRSRTVAISESNRDDLLEFDGFPRSKVVHIPNWVDPRFEPRSQREIDSIRLETAIPEAASMILFAGRLEHQKHPELAVQAIGALDVEAVLVVAGDGALLDSVRHQAKELNVELRVLGHVTDIERFMSAADAVIVPSRYEGFGRVAVEALAAGTNVVCADVPGLRDALKKLPSVDTSKVLVVGREAAEWGRALKDVLRMPRSPHTQHEEVMATYGLGASVERYLELYTGLSTRP